MKDYLKKQLYLYSDGSLYKFGASKLLPLDMSDGDAFPNGVIVVGREYTEEKNNHYPVTDRADLSAILKNEFDTFCVKSQPVVNERGAEVFTWQLKPEVSDMLAGAFTFWLPETFLLSGNAEKLEQLQRGNKKLLLCENGDKKFSSVAEGAFSDPNYFLMTLGLPNRSIDEVSEQEYMSRVFYGFTRLKGGELYSLLRAQNQVFRRLQTFPWKSVGAGLLTGWALVTGLHYLQLQYRISDVEEALQSQNISKIVRKRTQIKQKIELYKQLSDGSSVVNKDKVLWDVLASIMEANLRIIRFRTNSEGVQVRMETDIATEGLEAIKSMPWVKSASFAASVQNSLGKQRFTVDIVFDSMNRSSTSE